MSRAAALAALAAAALLAAGCGSDDVDYSTPEVSVTTAATRPAALPVPTAAQLDAQFRSAINPALPDSVRADLVQDGPLFVSALPDLYKSLAQLPNAKFGIVDPVFDNRDGTLTATMRLDKQGTGTDVQAVPVHFLALDGKWKLSRDDLCGLLVSADYHTPACG